MHFSTVSCYTARQGPLTLMQVSSGGIPRPHSTWMAVLSRPWPPFFLSRADRTWDKITTGWRENMQDDRGGGAEGREAVALPLQGAGENLLLQSERRPSPNLHLDGYACHMFRMWLTSIICDYGSIYRIVISDDIEPGSFSH